jgi:hypothetical protein
MADASTTYDANMLREYMAALPNSAVTCPACGGGATGERSFRIAQQPDGAVRGKCFRASCGFYHSTFRPDLVAVNHVNEVRLNPYTGPIRGLDTAEREWMKRRYGCELRSVGSTEDGRYVLPIWDDTGAERGVVVRVPHPGSPLRGDRDYRGLPKTMTYRSAEGPVQAWYVCTAAGADRDVAVLVEDQISAMKVRLYAGVTSVALLGTELTQDKVAELQRNVKRIVIALDSDATSKAFEHARRWGKAFESCKVLILEGDIKDVQSGSFLPALLRLANRRAGDRPAPARPAREA